MKLSIIIPCYNEEKTVKELISKVIAIPYENKEIIVVDDGSIDDSVQEIKQLEGKISKLICLPINQGKGAALHIGFNAATGDILIPQDADLELDPNDIVKVIEPIVQNKNKAACGSRFLNQKMKGSVLYRLANRILTSYSNLMSKQHLSDINVCYIAFKRELLKALDLKAKKFDFNPEIIGRLSNLGIKITEVPISYYPRSRKDGKKIKFGDGFRALRAIFKYRNKSKKPLV